MNTASLELWSGVLLQVQRSRLVLVIPPGSRRTEIQAFFSSKSIAPNRLRFIDPCLPHQHLIRYHWIDISLDPLPYTGHTSTLDSLWMGVPVVTLTGRTCVARGSVTALVNLHLPELIANDSTAYRRIAVQLAGDLPWLGALRRTLRDRMQSSPLCNEKQFTADLETAYRKMWHTYTKIARLQQPVGEIDSKP